MKMGCPFFYTQTPKYLLWSESIIPTLFEAFSQNYRYLFPWNVTQDYGISHLQLWNYHANVTLNNGNRHLE